MAHDPTSTTHDPRPTTHDPRLTTHDSRPTTYPGHLKSSIDAINTCGVRSAAHVRNMADRIKTQTNALAACLARAESAGAGVGAGAGAGAGAGVGASAGSPPPVVYLSALKASCANMWRSVLPTTDKLVTYDDLSPAHRSELATLGGAPLVEANDGNSSRYVPTTHDPRPTTCPGHLKSRYLVHTYL